ncbi:hypothetical protein AB0L47_10970 [Streptomyces bobili]|uniref:hypothetical protein n=1 Tax=Streptomyces bobili TaxID=67280 RepID=UPI00343485CA
MRADLDGAFGRAFRTGALERVSRPPHRLEQGVQRVQQAASVQQHRARLPGRHRERDQAVVGVGRHELDRQVVGDPQPHAVAQGIDRVMDDVRLCVLVGRQGDERRGDEGADLRAGRVLNLEEAVTIGVDARDDLEQAADTAPGPRP